MRQSADLLGTNEEDLATRVGELIGNLEKTREQLGDLQRHQATEAFLHQLDDAETVRNIPVLKAIVAGADADTLRSLTDRFRQRYKSGVVVLASTETDGKPIVVAAITEGFDPPWIACREPGEIRG